MDTVVEDTIQLLGSANDSQELACLEYPFCIVTE